MDGEAPDSRKRKRDETEESPTTPTFRLQAKSVLFTYKTHINKKKLEEFFKHVSPKREISFFRAAHENGDVECNYLHTHLLISWTTPMVTKNQRNFDFPIVEEGEVVYIHPHIKVLKNLKAVQDAKKYIAKEDPENADLIITTTVTIMNQVETAQSQKEFFREIIESDSNAWKNSLALEKIYQIFRPHKSVVNNWNPHFSWHHHLVWILEKKVNPRKIIWIFDRKGNTGKTAIARYLYCLDPESVLLSKDMGVSRDAATIVSSALEHGWNSKICLIDLPRNAENHGRMYQWLEEIKDGFVTTVKYHGETQIFPNPHLVVFSNWPPKVKALSIDRWDIMEIIEETIEDILPNGGNRTRRDFHLEKINTLDLLKEQELVIIEQ